MRENISLYPITIDELNECVKYWHDKYDKTEFNDYLVHNKNTDTSIQSNIDENTEVNLNTNNRHKNDHAMNEDEDENIDDNINHSPRNTLDQIKNTEENNSFKEADLKPKIKKLTNKWLNKISIKLAKLESLFLYVKMAVKLSNRKINLSKSKTKSKKKL